LRDDDEKSLSTDVTVFDKQENARVCIEIYKRPFSENARLKRHEELVNYYPDIEEVSFVVYRPLLEYYEYQIESWHRISQRHDTMEATSYSQVLQMDLALA
jgi:hypothetical protein